MLRMQVTVHSGRDLPKMDRFGKSDPYCVIQVRYYKSTNTDAAAGTKAQMLTQPVLPGRRSEA